MGAIIIRTVVFVAECVVDYKIATTTIDLSTKAFQKIRSRKLVVVKA